LQSTNIILGAAYAAGFLSQEDAWKIAYFRGLLSGNLAKAHPELDGIMMAVALSEDAVLGYTERTASGKVVAACINSPSSVTLSGDKTAIEEVQKLLETDNVWCRKLKVTTAYHSHHMNFIAGDYLKSIEDIKPLDADGSIRMFSSVTGKRILPADLGASYWVQNMLSPVRFSTAVSALLAPSDARSRRQKLPSVQVLLELGPHSVLKGPLNQILGASASGYENAVTYVSVLQRGTDAYESAVISAGKLWGAGQELNLGNVNSADEVPTRRKVLTDLPPYPWNHERSHWHESRQNAFKRLHARARTDLLGYPSDNFDPLASSHRWVNLLKPFEIPWVQDHVIQGNVIFPASAMIAMALEACQQLVDPAKTLEGFEFRDINFTRALLFATADSSHEVSMQFRPHVLGTRASTYVWHKFNMNSISAEGVTAEHCNGLVRVKYATKASEVENGLEAALESKAFKDTYEQISFKCHKEINVPQLYSDIAEEGMQFGPLFRLLSDMRGGEDVGVSSITIPDTAAIMPSNREFPLLLHPCVLDAIFQLMWSRAAYGDNSTGTMSVVAYVGNLFISADLPNSPGTVLRAYQSSKVMGHRDIFADIVVSDGDFAKPFVVCKQLVTTGLAIDGGSKVDATTTLLATRLVWKEDVASLSQESASLLGTPDSGVEIDMLSKATLLEQSAVIYIQRALSLLGLDRDKAAVQHPAIDWIRQYNTASFREDETTILTAAAESSSLGKAIEVIGTNLARVLDGSMDAHKLLLDEGLGSSRDFADELLCKELINSRIAAWFDLAGDKNPELQVLEIGNGCVSTAVSILGTLASQGAAGPRYDLYTFVETDSSRVADVKALLKEYPNVNVQSFDIERDLAMQHITKKYDVVIINNMGLANADVDFAIKNAKVLLKPGGTLIVAATATLSSRAALVLGSTEKWWIARGANALPQTRCIPLDAWSKLL
jgi:acyl transferase domain-containing protein